MSSGTADVKGCCTQAKRCSCGQTQGVQNPCKRRPGLCRCSHSGEVCLTLSQLQHCDKVLHVLVTWGMQQASLGQAHYLPHAGRKTQAEIRQAARSLYGDRASSGISSAASGAMNAVGAVWSFVSAEAATEGSLAPEDAAPLPPAPKMDISVAVSVVSEGQSLTKFQCPQHSNHVSTAVAGVCESRIWHAHFAGGSLSRINIYCRGFTGAVPGPGCCKRAPCQTCGWCQQPHGCACMASGLGSGQSSDGESCAP